MEILEEKEDWQILPTAIVSCGGDDEFVIRTFSFTSTIRVSNWCQKEKIVYSHIRPTQKKKWEISDQRQEIWDLSLLMALSIQ